MGKADELMRAAGGAILESASHRMIPAAMPRPAAGAAMAPDRLAGVARSKTALEIPLGRIGRDDDQPREEFDEDALSRLAESIRTKGLLQPITVRWVQERGQYVIIAGERRWRAAGKAGLETMSCVVIDRPLPPGELLAIQCVENLLREDLNPIEQARAFRTLMEVNGWSGNQLAKELGISQPAVVAALGHLRQPEEVQGLVASGQLAASSASAIAALGDPAAQVEVAARVVAEGLSRAETVEAVRRAASRPGAAGGKSAKAKGRAKVPTARVVRTSAGYKVSIEHRRGVEGPGVVDALREVVARLEAEGGLH